MLCAIRSRKILAIQSTSLSGILIFGLCDILCHTVRHLFSKLTYQIYSYETEMKTMRNTNSERSS